MQLVYIIETVTWQNRISEYGAHVVVLSHVIVAKPTEKQL